MAKILIYTILCVGIVIGAIAWWQVRVESERKKVAEEQKRQALKASVLDMAANVDALTDWERTLTGGERFKTSPVLTAELQKLWLNNRPILFVGYIEDIIANEDGTYQMQVGHGFNTSFIFLGNDIKVNLRCPGKIVAPIIEASKRNIIGELGAGVAVTGTIERIASAVGKDSEGNSTSILTGYGGCLDAIYLGEEVLW